MHRLHVHQPRVARVGVGHHPVRAGAGVARQQLVDAVWGVDERGVVLRVGGWWVRGGKGLVALLQPGRCARLPPWCRAPARCRAASPPTFPRPPAAHQRAAPKEVLLQAVGAEPHQHAHAVRALVHAREHEGREAAAEGGGMRRRLVCAGHQRQPCLLRRPPRKSQAARPPATPRPLGRPPGQPTSRPVSRCPSAAVWPARRARSTLRAPTPRRRSSSRRRRWWARRRRRSRRPRPRRRRRRPRRP
jgi:hypothetical protein